MANKCIKSNKTVGSAECLHSEIDKFTVFKKSIPRTCTKLNCSFSTYLFQKKKEVEPPVIKNVWLFSQRQNAQYVQCFLLCSILHNRKQLIIINHALAIINY